VLLLKFTVLELDQFFSKLIYFFPCSLTSKSNGFMTKLYFENSEFCTKEVVDLIQFVAIFFSVPEKYFRNQVRVSRLKIEFLARVWNAWSIVYNRRHPKYRRVAILLALYMTSRFPTKILSSS